MKKTNERSGHLRVNDYRRPRPRATPGATGVLPAFKVEIDVLFEGTHVVSTRKHCRGQAIPQFRGRKFLRNHTVAECHVQFVLV